MGYLTIPQSYDPAENDQLVHEDVPTSFKRKEVHCYYSDIVNSYILNAITGEKYPWRVGSKDEERFFRITNTVNRENPYRRTSRKAFYESPEEFMHHRKIILDEELVNQWHEKKNNFYSE
jgi:hypothetical protein